MTSKIQRNCNNQVSRSQKGCSHIYIYAYYTYIHIEMTPTFPHEITQASSPKGLGTSFAKQRLTPRTVPTARDRQVLKSGRKLLFCAARVPERWQFGCFFALGVLVWGVLVMRALLFAVYIRTHDCWKLPYENRTGALAVFFSVCWAKSGPSSLEQTAISGPKT